MIDNALGRKRLGLGVRLTVKTAIALAVVGLAVALPQLAHLAIGPGAGIRFLPMYLPVIIGGCMLGWRFGAAVGMASPLVSYLLTSAVGTAMPAASRLPFMMLELCVFAAVCGMFSKKIAKNSMMSLPAVLCAQLCGRSVFLLSVVLFGKSGSLTAEIVLGQIKSGIPGLVCQAVIVPLVVVGMKKLLDKVG